MQEIVYIITTFNPNIEVLTKLLSNFSTSRVIIVDNSDNINNHFISTGKINIVQNKQNLGFTGGANAGIRKALAKGAEWVVVMNYDLSVTKKSISQFNKILENSTPGVIGPFAGKLDPKRWTTIFPSTSTDYISGSCIAIHRKVIESIGLFYDPYFIYYEDADYCVRARRAGFPVKHVPISGITHYDSGNPTVGAHRHEYYLARNHLYFVERCAPPMVKAHEYMRLPKTMAEHIQKKDRGAIFGLQDYFFRRSGICNRDL